MKRVCAGIVAGWGLALIVGSANAQGGPPAAVVGVDGVTQVAVNQTVPVIGRFVTLRISAIAARVAGSVDKVFVDVGDRVVTGDILVEQDVERLSLVVRQREAAVDSARAAVRTAQANVNIYQRQAQRLEGLRNSAAFSAARTEDLGGELVRAESQLAEANARVSQSESDLEIARLDLEFADIRAPFSGIVIDRAAQPGEFMNAGATAVTLLDDQAMEVEADIPAVRVRGLTPGREIAAQTEGGELNLTVRSVIPSENPLTRTLAVRFGVNGSLPKNTANNQSVKINIPISNQRTVLSVHKDAVIQSPRGAMVFAIVDGKATPRPVQLGVAVGTRLEVLAGLEEGDTVVVRGNERLRPGQAVRF